MCSLGIVQWGFCCLSCFHTKTFKFGVLKIKEYELQQGRE